MENFKLQSLSEFEKREAEKNHGLVYSFLHRYGYSIEEYYNVVIFGYLKAVQIYNRREDLRNKYEFPCIAYQYMRSAVGNHLKAKQSLKRKPLETIISLDASYEEMENFYNSIGGKSAEDEVMEIELISEILENLSDVQKDIMKLKLEGYSNKEIYLSLEIKPSTYYKEMQRIRTALRKWNG